MEEGTNSALSDETASRRSCLRLLAGGRAVGAANATRVCSQGGRCAPKNPLVRCRRMANRRCVPRRSPARIYDSMATTTLVLEVLRKRAHPCREHPCCAHPQWPANHLSPDTTKHMGLVGCGMEITIEPSALFRPTRVRLEV